MSIDVELRHPEIAASSRRALFRHSSADSVLVVATLAQAGALLTAFTWLAPRGHAGALAAAACFGLGICWCSNTVAHVHLHKPLFSSRGLNRALSMFLGLLIGVPQSIWRARHFWHHAGEPAERRPRLWQLESVAEALPISTLWATLLLLSPRVFLAAYLPGFLLGMALCQLQGRMEHRLAQAPERGVSHYGRLHNFFWFNDGYHAEHHRFPAEHWTRLPARRAELSSAESAWPPLLRGIELVGRRGELLRAACLGALERLALRSRPLQQFMLQAHEAAFRRVLPPDAPISRIAIIGGGLFPRTLLVLERLFPESEIAVVDCCAHNVETARVYLAAHAPRLRERVAFVVQPFSSQRHVDFDLVVAPLAFVGDRADLLRARPKFGLVTHAWLWSAAGSRSAVVSLLLLKRLNLFLEADSCSRRH